MSKASISFRINDVAELIGVTPATIRNWEKKELFVAQRKYNNYRHYSLEDIETLRLIKKQSIDNKLKSSLIKTIIDSESSLKAPAYPEMAQPEINPEAQLFSQQNTPNKWKSLRKKKGLTLTQLSKEIDISASYLSKIEKGQPHISIDILTRLSHFYGEESLVEDKKEEKCKEKFVKKNQRQIIKANLPGVSIEALYKQKNATMRPVIFRVKPGSGSELTHQHRGEEFVHVIRGEVVVTLEGEQYTLKRGDSLYFQSTEAHSWHNDSASDAIIFWVHTPLSLRESSVDLL